MISGFILTARPKVSMYCLFCKLRILYTTSKNHQKFKASQKFAHLKYCFKKKGQANILKIYYNLVKHVSLFKFTVTYKYKNRMTHKKVFLVVTVIIKSSIYDCSLYISTQEFIKLYFTYINFGDFLQLKSLKSDLAKINFLHKTTK